MIVDFIVGLLVQLLEQRLGVYEKRPWPWQRRQRSRRPAAAWGYGTTSRGR